MLPLIVLLLSAVIPAPPAALWSWPTSGPQVVVRDFMAPLTPWGAGHRGLDLAAESDEVYAPTSGRVSFSGWVVNRPVVTITTRAGYRLSFEPVSPLIDTGDWVTTGELIGVLEDGHCATRCLHFGLRVGEDYRSPRRELGILQRAVLLPWEN
jgi:murein DD-endopeptidase MepM/ murein hydrolase activator NlpD